MRILLVSACLLLFYSCANVKKEYYETGELKSVKEMKGEVADGKLTKYYKSGKVKEESFWSNGKANGRYVYYYENGNVDIDGFMLNDSLNGEVKYYYESGELMEVSHIKNNLINGLSKLYYKDGHLEAEGLSSLGKPNGPSKSYFENGKCSGEKFFVDGIVFYEERFDSLGNSVFETREPILKYKKEMKLGDSFSGQIIIPGPIKEYQLLRICVCQENFQSFIDEKKFGKISLFDFPCPKVKDLIRFEDMFGNEISSKESKDVFRLESNCATTNQSTFVFTPKQKGKYYLVGNEYLVKDIEGCSQDARGFDLKFEFVVN